MRQLAIALIACSQSEPPPPVVVVVADAAPIVVDAGIDAVVGTGEGSGISVGRIGHSQLDPAVSVKLERPTIDGDLDKVIVDRMVRRNLARIRTCYSDALDKQPQLAGTVVAKFVVAPDGKVSSSTASGVDPKVADCIATAIREAEFPKSHGGAQASFPFTFSVFPDVPLVEGLEPAQILDSKAIAGDDVARTVQQHMRDFSSCYTKALKKQPKLAGKVVEKFTIGADGKVTASSASGLDPEVADCIAAAMRAIEFPKPPGGKAVEQTMPFTFVAQR